MTERPNRLQRTVQRLAMIEGVTRLVAPLVHAIDGKLLAWSGDRLCLTTPLTGLPVRRITTTGARSRSPRTHPITVIPDADHLAVIGSNFGHRHTPGWIHNLRADPRAVVHGPSSATAYEGRTASAAEYERVWKRAVELYPGYAAYARRAAPRKVPIFVLIRVADA